MAITRGHGKLGEEDLQDRIETYSIITSVVTNKSQSQIGKDSRSEDRATSVS